METENARREEQEKEGIEKQGSNEMLNDFLPIIECYLRIETLEKLISKIFRNVFENNYCRSSRFRSRPRISTILISPQDQDRDCEDRE